MSLHLSVVKRNFELEGIKHTLKPKRITTREDPLSAIRQQDAEERLQDEGHEEEKKETQTFTAMLGQVDPLAELHTLE